MTTTAAALEVDWDALEREFAYVDLLVAYPEPVQRKVERFARFARLCEIELEPFQRLILSEFFSGRRELIVLLPRGNGKTTLLALLALFVMITVPRAGVYVAAATAKQAKILFDESRRLARMHPAIRKLVTFRHNYLACQKTGGKLVFLASDRGGKAHGLIDLTLGICDELHAHVNSDTYIALRTAMGKIRGAQLVDISTAGMRLAGTLFDLRREAIAKFKATARAGTLSRYEDLRGRVAMLEWALAQDVEPATVTALDLKHANPATFVDLDFLQEQIDAPGLRPEEVCCFHGNVWARVAKSWLPAGAWNACYEEGASIPKGAEGVWLMLDIGVMEDSTALDKIWRRDDGRVVVESRVWTPKDGEPVDLTEVRQAVREARREYRVDALVMDRWNMELMAQEFDAEGLLVLDCPPRSMPKVSQALYEAVQTREIVHNGDQILAAHVAAGRTVHTDSGWKLAKRSRSPEDQVDALIALAIGFGTFKLNGGTMRASTEVFFI